MVTDFDPTYATMSASNYGSCCFVYSILTLAPEAWNKNNLQKSGDMSKPVLALLLAGILSGCVTSGGPYSQSASRAAQPQQARTQVQDKMDKSQVRSGSQIVLGTTY
jgi:hypothetical protein